MNAAAASTGFSGAALIWIVIAGLIWLAVCAFWIWLAVVAIQYLRVVTKAAHRYLDLTGQVPMAGPERGPEPQPQPVAPRGYS